MFEPQNGNRISYFGRENALGNHVFQTAVDPYSTVIGAYNSTAPIVFGHSNAEVLIRDGGWISAYNSMSLNGGLHVGTTSYGMANSFSLSSGVISSSSGWYDMRWNPNTGVVFHDGSCRLIKENIKTGTMDESQIIEEWTNDFVSDKNVPDGDYTVGDAIVTIKDKVVQKVMR